MRKYVNDSYLADNEKLVQLFINPYEENKISNFRSLSLTQYYSYTWDNQPGSMSFETSSQLQDVLSSPVFLLLPGMNPSHDVAFLRQGLYYYQSLCWFCLGLVHLLG